jgi:hypothetical protein
VHVLPCPLERRPLRGGRECPVADQGEQQALDRRRHATPARQPHESCPDPEPLPEAVEHVAAAHRLRVKEAQLLRSRRRKLLVRLQEAGDRAHQPRQRRPVEVILAAEAVDHLRHRVAPAGQAHVVGELHVAGDRAVLVAPLDRPQVHAHKSRTRIGRTKLISLYV